MLIAGFAGDEFVRIASGGGEGEDAVGFGFGRDDGVGEGLAVLAELEVEDVEEVAGGLVGELEERELGAELGCFAACSGGTASSGLAVGFGVSLRGGLG